MRYSPPLRLLSLALAGRDVFAFLAPVSLCVAAGDRCLHAQHGGVFAPVVAVRAGRPGVAATVAVTRKLSALR